jgi:hypothetical protein
MGLDVGVGEVDRPLHDADDWIGQPRLQQVDGSVTVKCSAEHLGVGQVADYTPDILSLFL